MTVKKKVIKKKSRGRKPNPVTAKRLKFCFEYIKCTNGQEAAIAAGFSEKTAKVQASQLLKVPELQAIIKAGLATVCEKAQIDAVYVLQGAKEMFERCMQHEEVTDKDGNRTGEYKFDSAGAGKALKLLGDHISIQAFKEKVEVSASKKLLEFFDGITKTTGPPSERGK